MLRVKVKVTPRARKERVIAEGEALSIFVREPAQSGLATARVKVLVARPFSIDVSRVQLQTGAQSRTKTFVLTD